MATRKKSDTKSKSPAKSPAKKAASSGGSAADGGGGGSGTPCDDEDCLFRSSDDVRDGYIRGIEGFDVKPVQYNVIDDMAIFEGDIALGTPDQVDQIKQAVENETSQDVHEAMTNASPGEVVHGVGIPGMRYRWDNGVVPYTVVSGLRNIVNQAIQHFRSRTQIRFVERTSANASRYPDYISFEERDGCWSYVGKQGGKQVVSLGTGCKTLGIAVHEICHALGMWHEQSREDRDRNVRIVWANIREGRENNFNQHITDGDDIGAYDFNSIMHYGRRAFSKNGRDTIVPLGGQAIGQRSGLSPGDIAAIRAMYPQLERPRTWRGTQFTGTLAPNQTRRWFTHSWPSHWFVHWNAIPIAPVIDGPPQIGLDVSVTRQADHANARLVKYHLTVRNHTRNTVRFQARYEVLGWHRSYL